EAARADSARPILAARGGAALPRPPDPEPGRGPRAERGQGAAAAHDHRGGSRRVRLGPGGDDRARRADAARAGALRPRRGPRRPQTAAASDPRLVGGLDETSAMPSGRPARLDAASSVAPIAM